MFMALLRLLKIRHDMYNILEGFEKVLGPFWRKKNENKEFHVRRLGSAALPSGNKPL